MNQNFVRTAMLPPELPPVSQRGVVKWMRENLFSSILNGVLTVLAVLVIYLIVSSVAPWLWHSVWNAGSEAECRAIVEAKFGPGATGACWAVIHERWNQFMFGLYPNDLYWRPTLAAVLLLVALAPVLFLSLPRQLLWVTILFPAIAFYLLWGGTVWAPVAAMLGFVVMGFAYRLLLPLVGVTVAGSLGFVASCLWWLFLSGYVSDALASVLPLALRPVDKQVEQVAPPVAKHGHQQEKAFASETAAGRFRCWCWPVPLAIVSAAHRAGITNMVDARDCNGTLHLDSVV